MTIYNTFPTFSEAETAQDYDFNRHCAQKFSEAIGIDIDIILNLNLHLDQKIRHQYYADNGITFTSEQKAAIHDLVNYFSCTNRWANISLYNNAYVYLACPNSDVVYSTINLSLDEIKSLKALNDDGIYIPATDWESL